MTPENPATPPAAETANKPMPVMRIGYTSVPGLALLKWGEGRQERSVGFEREIVDGIVTAVNAHALAVELAQAVLKYDSVGESIRWYKTMVKKARAFLELAGGKNGN